MRGNRARMGVTPTNPRSADFVPASDGTARSTRPGEDTMSIIVGIPNVNRSPSKLRMRKHKDARCHQPRGSVMTGRFVTAFVTTLWRQMRSMF